MRIVGGCGTIEHVFEPLNVQPPDTEDRAVLWAWLDDMDKLRRRVLRTPTAESAGWMEAVRAGARLENQAAAAQLKAIGELFAYRLTQSAETADWAIDTMEAVAAEVAAGLRISQRRAQTKLRWARALRERVPKVGALFAAGEIDFCAFATVVSRTELITDPEVLARVDGLVAANLTRWPSLTAGRLAGKVDSLVAQADRDAVRRRQERHVQREVSFSDDHEGITYLEGGLFTPMPARCRRDCPRWRRRCARTTHAVWTSAVPMPWVLWPPVRIGWDAAARARIAPRRTVNPPRRWLFTSSPSAPP